MRVPCYRKSFFERMCWLYAVRLLSHKNPWTICLSLLASTHVVGTVNIVSVLAMAPVISRDLELSATQFGLFVTAYYGAQAFWSLPSGGLTDRFGVARVIVVSHIIMVLAAIALSLASSYFLCLGAMFLMGIGYAMTNPSTSRGVLDWFPSDRRGMAMGLKQLGVPVGGIVAAGNGALAEWFDWRFIMLWVAAGIGFNGLLSLNLLHFDKTSDRRDFVNPIKSIIKVTRDANVNIFVWANGFLNFGQANFFSFLTLFLTEVALASQSFAGAMLGCVHGVSAIARVVWGILSDTAFKGRRSTLLIWLCFTATIFLVLILMVDPGWRLWAFGFTSIIGLGITIASFAPVGQAIGVGMVKSQLAGSAMGYNMLGIHIGGMLGPVVFGALVDLSMTYQLSWLVTALMVAIGTTMIAFWFRERG